MVDIFQQHDNVLCKGRHTVLKVSNTDPPDGKSTPLQNPPAFQISLHIAITYKPIMQFETDLYLGCPLKSAHSVQVSSS